MRHFLALGLVWLSLCLVSFIQFGIDKRRAVRGAWRIPERTLLMTAALGGAFGAWAGMYVFRHKTLHKRFRYGIPLLMLLHALLAVLLLTAR